MKEATTPTSINHNNQTRYISVTADIDKNHNIGLVSKKIQSKLDKYKTPDGYTIELTGETESINEDDCSCYFIYLFNNGSSIPIIIISIYSNVHYTTCFYRWIIGTTYYR